MEYLPKRLIDINLLQNMVLQNPFIKEPSKRLLAYDNIPSITKEPIKIIKLDKQIEKIKTSGLDDIFPSLLNGLLFITMCLIMYSCRFLLGTYGEPVSSFNVLGTSRVHLGNLLGIWYHCRIMVHSTDILSGT